MFATILLQQNGTSEYISMDNAMSVAQSCHSIDAEYASSPGCPDDLERGNMASMEAFKRPLAIECGDDDNGELPTKKVRRSESALV